MKSPIVGAKDRQHYSDLKVMPSAAGFYIGTSNHADGYPAPGTRESDYYRFRPEAETELQRREAMTPDEYRIALYRWAVQTDNLPIRMGLEDGLRVQLQPEYRFGPERTAAEFTALAHSSDPAPIFERLGERAQGYAEAENEYLEQSIDFLSEERQEFFQSERRASEQLIELEAQQDAAALSQKPELTPGPKR